MAIFATIYQYGPAEEQEKYRPAHRLYLANLLEAGRLVASGPFQSGEPGALLFFVAEREEQVVDMVEGDPMRINGVVLDYSIRQWNPVLGTVGQ